MKFSKTVFILALILTSACVLTAQPVVVPEWVKDAIFYQIFPERFANGDASNDPPGVEPWGGTPRGNNYFGGDLQGIIDHLDYLQQLGVNALYLTPVFESPTNHKYQTTDYLKIDPHFGTEQTFQRLLDECHRRKMHLIIDGVFNHTGVGFFAFDDVRKNGEKSPYVHWYNIHSFPVSSGKKPNYECWWGIGSLPKLMTDNPEVRKYLFDVTRHWTAMGLDGWRLDVANEISHDFWIQWRKLVKSMNPDAYIVGEIWDDASAWLKGDQFDGVMNYRFRGACVGFIALENRTALQFDSVLAAVRGEYPAGINAALQNLIGSHDTERFLTLCDGDIGKMKLAVLMQMTYLGAPMVYYGDEIGMEGGRDPDCRHTMIWDSTKWNRELLSYYRKLIALRRDNEVLRRGTVRSLMADDRRKVAGFERDEGEVRALVFLNNGTTEQRIPAASVQSRSGEWRDLLHGGWVRWSDSPADSIMLAPRSGVILLNTRGER